MKRRPLRTAYGGATLAALVLGLLAQPAGAHLNLQPRVIEQGNVTEIVVELPRLRPGAPPERLEVEGRGVEMLSSGLSAVAGTETRWNVRLRADAPPGNLVITLRAVYAGGRSVEVRDELAVVPAVETGSFPWPAAVAGLVLAVGLAAAVLVGARRRR